MTPEPAPAAAGTPIVAVLGPDGRDSGDTIIGDKLIRGTRELGPSALPDDAQVVTHRDLAAALGGSADSFTGDLLALIGKADPGNRARLQRAFPLHVAAWLMWQHEAIENAGHLREALGQ